MTYIDDGWFHHGTGNFAHAGSGYYRQAPYGNGTAYFGSYALPPYYGGPYSTAESFDPYGAYGTAQPIHSFAGFTNMSGYKEPYFSYDQTPYGPYPVSEQAANGYLKGSEYSYIPDASYGAPIVPAYGYPSGGGAFSLWILFFILLLIIAGAYYFYSRGFFNRWLY